MTTTTFGKDGRPYWRVEDEFGKVLKEFRAEDTKAMREFAAEDMDRVVIYMWADDTGNYEPRQDAYDTYRRDRQKRHAGRAGVARALSSIIDDL